jgi:hypothetical protein
VLKIDRATTNLEDKAEIQASKAMKREQNTDYVALQLLLCNYLSKLLTHQ